MNSTARTVSATLCENEPSPQSPFGVTQTEVVEAQHPDAFAGQLLADAARGRAVLAEGEPVGEDAPAPHLAFGQVDDTRQVGPVVLGKLTRSATCVILSLAG